MPLSTIIKQTEETLEEVLQTIRNEYEGPYPVLSETDRNRFVEEEESLRKQLKETIELESNCSSWKGLLLLRPSPPATKCLKDAQELRERVKEDINAKVRTRLTGKSSLPPLSSYGQGSARTPEINAGLPLAEGNLEPASAIITSPLNMRCSLSELEFSEMNVNPAFQNKDHDYRSDINEAINSTLEAASEPRDGTRNSSSRPRRRSPPPPPRRMVPSSNSFLSSETSSDSGSDSSRRSHSIRRPAPPPPHSPRQSRSLRSPINPPFPSPGPLPNPAMISSISRLAQDMNTLASSIVTEGLSRQASHGRQRQKYSDYVSKTNCVDINGSNVEGLTFNNNSTNSSGAVIHKTTMPSSRLHQPVPPL